MKDTSFTWVLFTLAFENIMILLLLLKIIIIITTINNINWMLVPWFQCFLDLTWMSTFFNLGVARWSIKGVNVNLWSGRIIKAWTTYSNRKVFISSNFYERQSVKHDKLETLKSIHMTGFTLPSVRRSENNSGWQLKTLKPGLKKQVGDSSQNTAVAFWQHGGRHW